MKLIHLFALELSFLTLSLHADEAATIYVDVAKDDEIAAKEGQKITAYGTSSDSAKTSSGTNYVNFKSTDFHLVTFASDLDQFPDGEPHEAYNEKRLAITGVVSIYRDKPQIKLTSPDQIVILEEDAVFPPVAKKKAAPDLKVKPEEKKPLTPQKPKEEEPKRKPPVDAKKYFK